MAGVLLKISFAAVKNDPIRLNVIVIQKHFGRRECISSNWAKHASFNSFLNFKHFAKSKGVSNMITGGAG